MSQKVRFAGLVLLISFAVCGTAFIIFPHLEKEVLPKMDQGQFIVKVEMPLGTRLEITDRVCQRLEKKMTEIPEIRDVAVTIGSEKSSKGQVSLDTLRPSQAMILVTLKKERKKSSAEVMRALEDSSKKVDLESGFVDYILQESEFAFAEGGNKPIQIEVKGYEYKNMIELVDRVKASLKEITGVINIQDDMGKTSPETQVFIDKKRAALYGISALDVSLIAKAALGGVVPTQYREGGKEYDVLVRLGENDRRNVQHLGDLLLYSKVLDALIPLKAVASIQQSASPSEIKRLDQERTIVISAEINDKIVKNSEVLPKVQTLLHDMQISPDSGMTVSLSGKSREIKESFEKMIFAFVLAFALVYMIMAAQFESFVQPLIIMITVPLAMFGVVIALIMTGTTINVISALGMIILVGTVVNNGIVLIEYINMLRAEGHSVEEAAWISSKVRTRPIIMSALTAVIGLVPLALGLGEGAEMRAPMAVSMMGGLMSSTFLTLIVLPAFYIVVTRMVEKLMGVEEEEEEEENSSEGESV